MCYVRAGWNMSILKRCGFFRELRHGDAAGLSLAELRGAMPPADRARPAAYLKGGAVLAATGTRVGDWFDTDAEPSIDLALLTDGTWVWRSDFAHYVENHGVAVPAELLSHMERGGWKVPRLTAEDLLAAEERFFSAP